MSDLFTDLLPVTKEDINKVIQDRVIPAYKKVEKVVTPAFQKVLNLERKIQARVLGTVVPAFLKQEAPEAAPTEAPVVLQPVQLSGFYTATSSNIVTFFVMTSWPMLPGGKLMPLGPGWRAVGITNLVGNIIVTKVTNKPGVFEVGPGNSESYLWSFE